MDSCTATVVELPLDSPLNRLRKRWGIPNLQWTGNGFTVPEAQGKCQGFDNGCTCRDCLGRLERDPELQVPRIAPKAPRQPWELADAA